MLESLYVRDSNKCSLFAVAIAVFSLAEKMVTTVLAVLGRIGPFGSDWVEFRQAGSKFDRQALL